ncbi:MAG: glycosyltransferase [Calditrichaeota bacterium]|nr:glycosyltransferase [Calditrichota bacterium]RQW05066.1 MAG: glycosyltransferase [Calditrichota bacterium]
MDISVVIPAYNEAESLPELLEKIHRTITGLKRTYEIVVVDDGSHDATLEVLRNQKKKYPSLKVISFRRNYGKSAALSEAFKTARGDYIITMDADLQDDPEEIPSLLENLNNGKYDLISGWKKKRHDPISKTIPSKLFNFVTSRLTGIRIHDFNCGLKAYRKEVIKDLQIYGELHRFLPVLAHWNGFRVGETVVKHHPRRFGKTKFGISRFFNGFFDLLTVLFITRYQTSPLHIFGMLGLLTALIGLFIELYLTVLWFSGQVIRNRPLFFLGILAIIVGVQFIVFGLLGEMIAARFASQTEYSIKEKVE